MRTFRILSILQCLFLSISFVFLLGFGSRSFAEVTVQNLGAKAQAWAQLKHWPATGVSITKLGVVSAASRGAWAVRIVDAVATVNNNQSTQKLEVRKFSKNFNFSQTRATWSSRLVTQPGLLLSNDVVYKVTWAITGLGPFDTLAIVDPAGRIKFEPVLALDGITTIGPPVGHHSDLSIPITAKTVSGLDDECFEAHWLVTAQTNQCNIPSFTIAKKGCTPRCFGWDAQCAEGNTPYNIKSPPVCRVLQCQAYVGEADWASWSSTVEVQVGAGISVPVNGIGVTLDAKVKTATRLTGHADSVDMPGRVCADGTAILDGMPVTFTKIDAPAPIMDHVAPPENEGVESSGVVQENEWSRSAKQWAQRTRGDPCDYLRDQKNAPENRDAATQQKIKQAQKYLGCRPRTPH